MTNLIFSGKTGAQHNKTTYITPPSLACYFIVGEEVANSDKHPSLRGVKRFKQSHQVWYSLFFLSEVEINYKNPCLMP